MSTIYPNVDWGDEVYNYPEAEWVSWGLSHRDVFAGPIKVFGIRRIHPSVSISVRRRTISCAYYNLSNERRETALKVWFRYNLFTNLRGRWYEIKNILLHHSHFAWTKWVKQEALKAAAPLVVARLKNWDGETKFDEWYSRINEADKILTMKKLIRIV